MRVILLKDVPGQGKSGDVLDVKEGFARNYLFPRNLAVEASKSRMKELDARRQTQALKRQKKEQEARELASRFDDITVVVKAKTGEGGKLFGSVNNKDIADALLSQHKINLDKKKIIVQEPIKRLGAYSVTAKLHPGVQVKIKVEVLEE